jgi:predicted metalloenzyme YecM
LASHEAHQEGRWVFSLQHLASPFSAAIVFGRILYVLKFLKNY